MYYYSRGHDHDFYNKMIIFMYVLGLNQNNDMCHLRQFSFILF
jgi:hypothetical protein